MTDASNSEVLPPWAAGVYSIKRDGVTLTNCDSEPVQTPGCIQDHGALLVLRRSSLEIVQVSENSEKMLGHAPQELLGKPVTKVITAAGEKLLETLLAASRVDSTPLYAFSVPMPGGDGQFDVSFHTSGELAILEFEATGRAAGEDQRNYYDIVKRTFANLQAARTLREYCQVSAEEIRLITGLDRVMIYRFHEDYSGEVLAESKRDELPSWVGLRYPAEDIPEPARKIFMKLWVRPLPDAQGALVEMVPLLNPVTNRALDMTHCALRGASIMYTEYLKNMGVRATLTLPIRRDNKLWGLIACHHYSPHPFSWQMRASTEFMAQCVSLQLSGAEEREHSDYRARVDGVHQQLLTQAAQEGGLSAMTDAKPSLLEGLEAGGAALYHRERWWCMGKTPTEVQLNGLADWLRERPELAVPTQPHFVTSSLASLYPPAAAFTDVASGLLAVPVSKSMSNALLWFRPEEIQTVKWAGNPQDVPAKTGAHGVRLTPRKSFAEWVDSVRRHSKPWLDIEVEMALRLRFLVMELVVSRAERMAKLNADLSRSVEELDAFAYVASHDLKEPLRGIHKYAHLLKEKLGAEDAEARERLDSMMRLTSRMDNLLDSLLHFSRVGRIELELESTDLNVLVNESIEMLGARQEPGKTVIKIARPLPTIHCDRVRVREIFVNLIGNALKYNDKPLHEVEIGWLSEPVLNTPPEAAGQPIYYVKDNGIGIPAKHFEQIFRMFKRLHGRDEYSGGTGAGLTIVKKLVERHYGCIWLESTPQIGTTFFFTLGRSNG